jgi:hypothetical protein
MPFRIAHSIFSLAIGLILRLGFDLCTGRTGALVVCIYVIDMHD